MNKISGVIIEAGCSGSLPWMGHIYPGKSSSPSWRVEREYFFPHMVRRIYWEAFKNYMRESTLLVHSHRWLGMFPESAVIQGEMSDGSELSSACSVEGSSSEHAIETLPEQAEHMPTILLFANSSHACYFVGVSTSDLKLTPLCS